MFLNQRKKHRLKKLRIGLKWLPIMIEELLPQAQRRNHG
jgi:hypothetical protein